MPRLRDLIREIHRRSLWQVLAVYGLGSWVIYQVVIALWEGVGLPDWVPSTALVLLLVGLPIVVATAFVQDGPPGLHTTDRRSMLEGLETTTEAVAAARDAKGPSHRPDPARKASVLTWPRAVTGGILAFAALGLAASGFLGMRALGIGPAATLVSSGVLETRESILLSDFTSRSADTVLADAVTEALRVDLEESPVVRVLQPSHVAETLRRMERDPRLRLTPGLAREIAVRDGIRVWLEGDVTAAGAKYVLTARLVATATGEPLLSIRETAPADEILEATDKLSRTLRERIGESFRSVRASEPLASVTTPSLEALRKYSQAVRAFDTEQAYDKAIALLEDAVALDTAFAMAWRKLGVAYANAYEHERMVESLRKAYTHRDRLTDRERYLTLATYYSIVEEDSDRAITAYETVLDLHPSERTALHNLANQHRSRGDTTKAIGLYRRAVEADPYSALSYSALAGLLAAEAEYDEAIEVIRRYQEVFPEHSQASRLMAYAMAAQGRYDSAAMHLDRVEALGNESMQRNALMARASLAAVRGRVRQAERWFDRYWSGWDRDQSAPYDDPGLLALRRAYELAVIDYAYRHDPEAAWRRVSSALDTIDVDRLLKTDFPGSGGVRLRLAYAHSRFGKDGAAARNYLSEIAEPDDRLVFDLPFQISYGRSELEAYASAAAGDFEEAIRLMRRSAMEGSCTGCSAELAWIFDQAGRPDSAIAHYESFLDQGDLYRLSYDARWRARAHERLGELYEAAGERERAARHYTTFVDLWRHADPELQPRVEAARRALARLTGEGGL